MLERLLSGSLKASRGGVDWRYCDDRYGYEFGCFELFFEQTTLLKEMISLF